LNSRSVAEFQTPVFGAVDSSLYEMGLRFSSDPFAGCIDLMQHSGIRGYTRLHELRIIEILAGLEWASYDILGHSSRRKTLI
jgi:hypothetical protein